MKKYLSFILTICILLGCASLISCNFEGIFGKTSSSTESTEPAPSEPTQPSEQSTQPTEPTQSTAQPTEPTSSSSSTTEEEPQPEPEELVFEHSDNFTEEDIEFVKNLQGRQMRLEYEPAQIDYSNIIELVSLGAILCTISIDIENPYFICAYLDLDDQENVTNIWIKNELDITKYSWFKFYDYKTIPGTIGEKEKAWSYLLYDCVLEGDVFGEHIFNRSCKYFMKYSREVDIYKARENLAICYMNSSVLEPENNMFIEAQPNNFPTMPISTNSNGQNYITFQYQGVFGNTTQEIDLSKQFGKYYDDLSDHFEYSDEFDYTYTINENVCTIKYVGIKLDCFINYLKFLKEYK